MTALASKLRPGQAAHFAAKSGLWVADDPALLELMMEDTRAAPALYRATNYWARYENPVLRELRTLGLAGYRGRRDSTLASFCSAGSAQPPLRISLESIRLFNNRFTARVPYWRRFLRSLSRNIESKLPLSPESAVSLGHDLTSERLYEIFFEFARSYGEKSGARTLGAFEASSAGEPQDMFAVGGKRYTPNFLTYYMRYAYCSRFFDFREAPLIVELGTGGGEHAEALKKAAPEATILQFDIAPALYVCEQYLKTVFPDDVVSYRDTRNLTSLKGLTKGGIYIIGSHQFPLLVDLPHDLFVSCSSFAEMEPDVVRNYLGIVNASAKNAYISQVFEGKSTVSRHGQAGVLETTVARDYEESLADLECTDFSPSVGYAGTASNVHDSFWKRKC